MTEPSIDYSAWHLQFADADDTQSVWHLFVKQQLAADQLGDKVVLEIGCGRGGLSNYMMRSGRSPKHLYACDFSADAIAIAQARFGSPPGLEWRQEDIQAINLPADSVDRIISCETIEHVPRPEQAIRELYRVLRPGGTLYLTCPNYFNFFGLWCVYRWLIGKPFTEGQPFVNYIVLPRLLSWIRKAGFKIDFFKTTNLVFPLRAHFHFFEEQMPGAIRWLGFRCYFVLQKPR